MSDERTTKPAAHVMERHGALLEKFEKRGDLWVSQADGRTMTQAAADAAGWVYVAEVKRG